MKWMPLPKIAHGVVIYPFSPSTIQPKSSSTNNKDRPSSVGSYSQTINNENSVDVFGSTTSTFLDSQNKQRHSSNMEDYSHLIHLEVGDEVYIIEQNDQWCRGYVCTMLEEGRKPKRAPIGCFPRTHIHIKEYIDINTNESDPMIHNQIFNENTWNYVASKSKMPFDLNRSFSDSHIDTSSYSKMPSYNRTGSLNNLHDEIDRFLEAENIEDSSTLIPPPPLPASRLDQSTLIGYAEPLVDEIAACITEWNSLFYTYLSQRDYETFNFLKDNVNYLLQSRRQLLDQVLSREEIVKLRKDSIQRMLTVNLHLHEDMIIRHPEKGYLLDIKNTSLGTIYQLHWRYATEMPTALDVKDTDISSPTRLGTFENINRSNRNSSSFSVPSANSKESPPQLVTAKFYHIYMALNSFVAQIGLPGEFTELHFALYSTVSHKFITEEYIIVLNYDGTPRNEKQVGKLQALFVDLSSRDVSDGLYLVCNIFRLGSLKMNDSFHHYFGHFNNSFLHANRRSHLVQPTHTLCKRPFGCAVLKLTLADFQQEAVQFDMPIFTPFTESNFTKLHEEIINNNSKDVFRKIPQAEKLVITLQSFYGCIRDILRVNTKLLQNATHTLRIGFADVSFPNDSRNELYIRLSEGDFLQFGRSRNIQVNMCVRDNETGEIVENAISVGAGKEAVTYWQSMVIYHEQRPKWNEQIKIKIEDVQQWQRSHVFITVKHRSSYYNSGSNTPSLKMTAAQKSNVSGGAEQAIAMGFLPIFLPPSHRDMVADGSHVICLYKYDPQLAHPQYYLNGVTWCSKSTAPLNMSEYRGESRVPKPFKQPYFGSSTPSSRSFRSSTGSLISSGSFNAARASTDGNLSALYTPGQQFPTNKLVPLRDKIYLVTLLCSTKFTQNKTLLKLLNWNTLLQDAENGRSELLAVLDQFSFVGEVEVVKFLTSIFDALLNIMVYHEDENEIINREIHDQVLSAIVWLLSIVQDRRFSNFKPGLDTYLDNRFSKQTLDGSKFDTIGTFKYFVSSLTRLCENPGEPLKAKLLRSSMKVWSYLFRFIVRSRLYHQSKEDFKERTKNDELFKNDMYKLLAAITNIMSPEHPNSMIGTQTLALQHFAEVLGELQKIFSCKQMVDITISFVNACSRVTGKLVGFKLIFILNLVQGRTIEDPSFKTDIVRYVFRWIEIWINCYMSTAKNVIFAKKEQQQSKNGLPESNRQQNRLPKAQWIENLRLSLTILKELLNNVRKSKNMDSSELTSSGVSSPVLGDSSRPTSFSTINTDKDEDYQNCSNLILEEALHLVPQLLSTYRDLQRLVIQAIQVSDSPEAVPATPEFIAEDSNPNSRPSSRHSFGKLRERALSVNSKTPLSADITQELQTPRDSTHVTNSGVSSSSTMSSGDNKTKFNIILQALSTSPETPFPSVFPFPPDAKEKTSSADQSAMVTTGLLDLTVVFLELFYLLPQHQWVLYIENMLLQDGFEETARFLRKIVYTCMGILFGDNILSLEESTLLTDTMGQINIDPSCLRRRLPHQWLNLSVIAHKIILCDILDPIKTILQLPQFMPSSMAYTVSEEGEETSYPYKSNTVEQQKSALLLWRGYYVGFLRIVGSPRLGLSEFKPQSQRAIWELAGNLRGEYGAKTFLFLWNLAGQSNHAFTSEDHRVSDYFNHHSFFDYGYFSDVNPTRKSGASNEDTDNYFGSSISSQNTSIYNNQRNSIRIAPTDEVPLKGSGEEKQTTIRTNIPFLQVDLAHFILRPMTAVSLTLHDRVRVNALSIIADIIAIELYSYGELLYAQKTLIGALDHFIMSENKGDEELAVRITTEFRELLSQRLQKDNREDLQLLGKRIIDSFSRFFSLLLQVRSLPADDDEYLDERIMATLRLMKFIQVIEREEIYVKYVHQLVQVHLDNNCFIEAALTLRFHSDLLLWDTSDRLASIPDLGFPVQSSFDRKEELYLTMIQYLDKGCAWEICVTFCKELAYEYEHTQFDYSKLTDILQRQAVFVDSINKKERCFTEYFRVGFYGRGFPASNRNRQYIYRGLEWEKLGSFIERMQSRHPNAKMLPSKIANSMSLTEEQLKEFNSASDGQYIQITPVVPIPDRQMMPCLSSANAPENIKKFYEFNNVNKFVFTKVIVKETSENAQPEIDFLNLWTERIELECEDRFPTIVRRSKIVKSHSALISPIENAIETVENKTRELISLERKYSVYVPSMSGGTQHTNISPFSMSLNGAVDAPVNGGIPLYKKSFLSKEYWDENPNMRHLITRLQEVIHDQVFIIQKCLDTHDMLVSNEMRPFHSTLVDFFRKNFADEIKMIKDRPSKDENREKHASSIFTNRRISTLSSATDANSVYSHHYQQSYDDPKPITRQNTVTMAQTPGAVANNLPAMSPVSRAFSIKSPTTENSPDIMSSENAAMSRTESLSRTLKMSLRKKPRNKS